jgi:hypothetical protein
MSKKWMFGFLILLLAPVWAVAGEGFLETQDRVPDVMVRSGSDDVMMSCQLDSLVTYTFTGFEPGSSDIPEGMVSEINSVVDRLAPNQYVFVQGRTDKMGWYDRYRPKEDDRLDIVLGLTRGEKVLEMIQTQNPDVVGRIYLLNPVLVRNGRGVDVHVATYIDSPEHDHEGVYSKTGHDHNSKYASKDHAHAFPVPKDTLGSGLRMGAGLGFYNVKADRDMSFSVPTINLYLIKSPFELSGYIGRRPTDDRPVEGYGKTYESIVGGDLSYIYRDLIGVSGGVNCAWETLNRNDEYLKKALGFYAGPKIYIGSRRLNLQAGVNFQESNLNRVDEDPWWDSGYNLFASARYVFGERGTK